MRTAEVKCPYCGALASVADGQSVDGSDLRWWESFSCNLCGTRTEADGGEDMPDAQRVALLEQEGTWSVVVAGEPSVAFLKSARENLNLTMQALAELKTRLPGVLATGTRCEMEVLANRLRRSAGSDVPVRVERT